MAATREFGDLGLSIIGIGRQYPPYDLKPDSLETLSKRYHPETPAMKKVLSINRYTGIDTRSSVGTPDHPVVNQEKPPSIAELHRVFLSDGVPLAVAACRKALAEARVDLAQITHVVSTTCTDSANPGFDHHLCKQLGLGPRVEKVLLHGVGCSGGLAALRTGAGLALGLAARGRPARVLCVALEVCTTLARSELESIHEAQETRVGAALFSDCASAAVLANGVGEAAEPVYELLAWDHRIIPDTEEDLGFDVDPLGWKVILTPRVPQLAAAVLRPAFDDLTASLGPSLPPSYRDPADFDWAMHPGGATILTGAERALGIAPEHMRASYDTYMRHGNSSSATILSVLDRLRDKDMDALAPPPAPGHAAGKGGPRDYVVGCAFGPGVAVEMCMLRRNLGATGLQTPPPEADGGGGRPEQGPAAAGPPPRPQDESFISEAVAGAELD